VKEEPKILHICINSSLLLSYSFLKTEDKAGLRLNTKNSKTVFYFLITIMFKSVS